MVYNLKVWNIECWQIQGHGKTHHTKTSDRRPRRESFTPWKRWTWVRIIFFLYRFCPLIHLNSAEHEHLLQSPHANFEKMQDILLKRKGMRLDSASSGALFASSDLCVDSQSAEFRQVSRTCLGTSFCILRAYTWSEIYVQFIFLYTFVLCINFLWGPGLAK